MLFLAVSSLSGTLVFKLLLQNLNVVFHCMHVATVLIPHATVSIGYICVHATTIFVHHVPMIMAFRSHLHVSGYPSKRILLKTFTQTIEHIAYVDTS